MASDLIVFAKDYPEVRLMVDVKPDVSRPLEEDPTVKELMRSLWGANCHYGLIVTPTQTYVLRDDFRASGPEAIHVTDVLSTGQLFRRMIAPLEEKFSERELEMLTHKWLSRLADSYDSVLPDDPEVMRAFFPDIVGAVADGRIVA
ncbi:MAG: hypothetical protein ACRELF_05890 [Gemmataceae bacterium]